MCTVFWDRQGVLLVEFLPWGTINSAVFCETLKKLRRAIQNKRRGMPSATILLLHGNARPHSAGQTQDLITSFRWEQTDQLPPPVQPWFGAKWFSPLPTPKEVPGRQAIWQWWRSERCSAKWLTLQVATFYEKGIQKLVPCYNKRLNDGGEYVEK